MLNITFFGTQPTFTQVPPKACFSTTATFAPYVAARRAEAIPIQTNKQKTKKEEKRRDNEKDIHLYADRTKQKEEKECI